MPIDALHLWVGIGCNRGTSKSLIETAIQQTFQANHLPEAAIAGIATLDLKASEVGLIELCQGRQWSLRTFSAELLHSVGVQTPSSRVAASVGSRSVAEAAALAAANSTTLLVPKQIYRWEQNLAHNQPLTAMAVTVAVAKAKQEDASCMG